MTARPGFILLYSILLILALSVLSAGMMTVALRERQIARTHARVMQVRATAESAARVTVAEWLEIAEGIAVGETRMLLPDQTSGGGDPTPTGSPQVAATRLAPSLYLVRAVAPLVDGARDARTASGEVDAAMLVRTVDTAAILDLFPAAVTADSLVEIHEATVSGWDACGRAEGPAPGAMAPRVEVDGPPPEGMPPLVEVAPPPRPAGDPLAQGTVPAIRDQALTGQVAPAPSSSGADCLVGPSNWGAVSPGHPCHELLPLIEAEDGIVVSSGEARGILVVMGDGRLEGPLDFEGLILATGRLSMGPGVRVRGAVRARHVILNGADVVLDRCAQRAVLAAPAFRKPLQPVSRWWIPSF